MQCLDIDACHANYTRAPMVVSVIQCCRSLGRQDLCQSDVYSEGMATLLEPDYDRISPADAPREYSRLEIQRPPVMVVDTPRTYHALDRATDMIRLQT